ncbi:hypothetical protein [Peribacillus kribbensis]|nr:hypothetical protein [Peribacillus kribbensis]
MILITGELSRLVGEYYSCTDEAMKSELEEDINLLSAAIYLWDHNPKASY